MLRQFLREICSDWVSLVSGIASFLLAAVAAIFSESLPTWIFWPAAYLCLICAGYRLWARERKARINAEETLAARIPLMQNEAAIRHQIDTLTSSELLALKHLVACGQLTEEQLAEFCQRNGLELVTPGMLATRVTFLTRDYALGAWSVLPRMEAIARKIMSEVTS